MTNIIIIIIIITVVLMGKSNRRKALGRPTCGWECTIKMYLQQIGWGVDWIDLAQDRATWWWIFGIHNMPGIF
jgi:hypothetical protein